MDAAKLVVELVHASNFLQFAFFSDNYEKF